MMALLTTENMIVSGPPIPGYSMPQFWPWWCADTTGHCRKGGVSIAELLRDALREMDEIVVENNELREENRQLRELIDQYIVKHQ